MATVTEVGTLRFTQGDNKSRRLRRLEKSNVFMVISMVSHVVPILLTVAAFALMIVFHEFGHFIVAKLSGMTVYEFALGFGRPILLTFKRGDTQYSLRPIPIGGFVRIAGMEPEEDVPGGFDKQPIWSRMAVIASGSIMNLVLAAILFVIMGLAFGRLVGVTSRLQQVNDGGPAARAGIRPGDQLLSAAPVPVTERAPAATRVAKPARVMTVDQIRQVIIGRPDMPVRVIARRGNACTAYLVTPQAHEQQEGRKLPNGKIKVVTRTVGLIGVVFANITKPVGWRESITDGFVATYQTTSALIGALWMTATGRLPAEFAGPLRITDIMTEAARTGLQSFMSLLALISVNLAVVNLLPIPALDGSRLVFLGVEGIRRRPVDKRKEAIVHLVGFALLLALLALLTINDLRYLVAKYIG